MKTFRNDSEFVNPDWLRQYILCLVADVIDFQSSKIDFDKAVDFYMSSRKHQATKFTDFLTNTLTTTLIMILLKFGDNPLLHQKNENTMGIREFPQSNSTNLAKGGIKMKDIMHHCTTVYELCFTALPGLFEKNSKQHKDLNFHNFLPATELGKTIFHKKSTIKDFCFQLPMKKHNKFESVMLTDYFQGILDGQISIKT